MKLFLCEVCTDAPSIPDTPSILGVSSTFRTPSAESIWSTGGLSTRSIWSMSSTDDSNTASTGSTSSTSSIRSTNI